MTRNKSPISLNTYVRPDITVPKTFQVQHRASTCVQLGIIVQLVHLNRSRVHLENTVRCVQSVTYLVNQKTVLTGLPMEFTALGVAKNRQYVQLVVNVRRVNRWCYLFYVNLVHGNR